MGISNIAHWLPGSKERPDTVTFAFIKTHGSTLISSTNCKLNILGYIPVVSTITGLSRALLGLVHTIIHLVCAVFGNREMHLKEACLGLKNICIGLIEAIPVIGNITILFIDIYRIDKYEKQAQDLINKNHAAYNDQAVLFIYGEEVAKRSLKEYNAEVVKIKTATATDIEKIIRNSIV